MAEQMAAGLPEGSVVLGGLWGRERAVAEQMTAGLPRESVMLGELLWGWEVLAGREQVCGHGRRLCSGQGAEQMAAGLPEGSVVRGGFWAGKGGQG